MGDVSSRNAHRPNESMGFIKKDHLCDEAQVLLHVLIEEVTG
jgi:hypothetical protein